jgi:hypothetical protein
MDKRNISSFYRRPFLEQKLYNGRDIAIGSLQETNIQYLDKKAPLKREGLSHQLVPITNHPSCNLIPYST